MHLIQDRIIMLSFVQNKVKKGWGLKTSIKNRRTLFWRPHHTLSQSQNVVLIKFGKKISFESPGH